jgi:putative DNA primase/helicase
MRNIVDVTAGRWHSILTRFGVDPRFLTGKNGPCLLCAGKDRWRWIPQYERYVCSQCTPVARNGITLLQNYTGRSFKDLAQEISRMYESSPVTPVQPKKDANILLDRIASGCIAITQGDPVDRYLASRGLKASPYLRYNPAVKYYQDGNLIGDYPALVARISNMDGDRESYQVLYLTDDGDKADLASCKKVLPPVTTINGCGSYLGPVSETMIVAEGVETALACSEMEGFPAVAAMSASGMKAIKLPESVKTVLVHGDNDRSYTGQAAAYHLANRLAVEGRNVLVSIPHKPGEDWLDVLNKLGRDDEGKRVDDINS